MCIYIYIYLYLSIYLSISLFVSLLLFSQAAGASSAAQSRIFAQYYLATFAIFGMVYMGLWFYKGYMTATPGGDVGPYQVRTYRYMYVFL